MNTLANQITSCADDDNGEAAFNEDAFEESEHVSDMLGDNVKSKDTVEDEGSILNNDFCFTEDDFIETRQQMLSSKATQEAPRYCWKRLGKIFLEERGLCWRQKMEQHGLI